MEFLALIITIVTLILISGLYKRIVKLEGVVSELNETITELTVEPGDVYVVGGED